MSCLCENGGIKQEFGSGWVSYGSADIPWVVNAVTVHCYLSLMWFWFLLLIIHNNAPICWSTSGRNLMLQDVFNGVHAHQVLNDFCQVTQLIGQCPLPQNFGFGAFLIRHQYFNGSPLASSMMACTIGCWAYCKYWEIALGPWAWRLDHCGGWMSGIMACFAGVACGGHVIGKSGLSKSSFYEGAAGFKRVCNMCMASMVLLMASG